MDYNIEDIRKEMTRQEFINQLEDSNYGLKFVEGLFNNIDCPSDLGLPQLACNSSYRTICKECWLNAIKDVKFKDKIEKENQEQETINEEKEYSALEILHMINDNKLTDNDIIIGKDKNETTIYELRTSYSFEVMKLYEPYIIYNKKSNYVTFEKAVKSNTLISNKYIQLWLSFKDIITYLDENFNRDEILKMFSEKVWLIK